MPFSRWLRRHSVTLDKSADLSVSISYKNTHTHYIHIYEGNGLPNICLWQTLHNDTQVNLILIYCAISLKVNNFHLLQDFSPCSFISLFAVSMHLSNFVHLANIS